MDYIKPKSNRHFRIALPPMNSGRQRASLRQSQREEVRAYLAAVRAKMTV